MATTSLVGKRHYANAVESPLGFFSNMTTKKTEAKALFVMTSVLKIHHQASFTLNVFSTSGTYILFERGYSFDLIFGALGIRS